MRASYSQLSREQDNVLELPLDGCHVVTGGPGTGKTTIAIYRALVHRAAGDTPVVVVPDLLRKICLVRRMGSEKNAARILTQWELLDLIAPGLRGDTSIDEADFWIQALVTMATRRASSRGRLGEWALIIDDAHDLRPEFHDVAAMFANRCLVLHDPSVVSTSEQSTLKMVEKSYQTRAGMGLNITHRWSEATGRLAASLVSNRNLPLVPCDISRRSSVRGYSIGDERRLAKLVHSLWQESVRGRIVVTCRTEGRFQLLSRYLRQAVDEEAFTPIWPNRTARLTKRDARTAVTLIREDLLRGVEFDTVVISELDEVIDDVSSPSYRIALYRAVASSRGEVHLTWFREGGADALSNSINGIELPQA